MSRITSHIFIGDMTNAQNLIFLQSKQIGLIVNCAKELPEFFPSNFTYIHLHWDDTLDQNIIKDLEFASNSIIEAGKQNIKVLVHCAAGISRSSSVVIYTLMKLHHWPYEKAFLFVKDAHPRTQPNSHFVQQLLKLQMHLQNSNKSSDRIAGQNFNQNSVQNIQPQKIEKQPSPLVIEDEYARNNFELINNQPSKYKRIAPETIDQNKNILNNENVMGGGINYPQKQTWSKLTFDCENCELPSFISNGKGLYAKIFS